jgi:hypothetical protein
MFVFHTSCGQNQTNSPKENIKSSRANYSESQLKEAATSKVPMGSDRAESFHGLLDFRG